MMVQLRPTMLRTWPRQTMAAARGTTDAGIWPASAACDVAKGLGGAASRRAVTSHSESTPWEDRRPCDVARGW